MNASDELQPVLQDSTPNLPPASLEPARVPLTTPSAPSIVIQDSAGAVSRLVGWMLAWIGWGCLLIAIIFIFFLWSGRSEYYDTTGGITESYFSGDRLGDDKIAIVTISGVIYDGDGFVKRQVERIRTDDNVKAVVIRVDSPGGTVSGSDYMYHHLKKLRSEKNIPMVVSMGSLAASGGYYVSMAVGDREGTIFAEPTTSTGSIGVIIPHYDISGLLARFDVADDSIVSHPRKQMLSMTRPIDPEQREILQAHVNELFTLFKARIKDSRPYFKQHPEKLDELATGEIFTAEQAKRLKLVDEIGFIEEAIDCVAKLAGLKVDEARVVRYQRPETLLDLAGLATAQNGGSDLNALLELSTPRAYYLATSLPPLVTSRRE
jgi:protease-4